jgi:hypothetical protein
MDLLAHAVYGATVCSRTGLAGGSKGSTGVAKRHWITDWTVWCATLFSILPDAVSMGTPLVSFWSAGMQGHFFRDIGDDAILRYRYMHSLIVALAASSILRLMWKPLFVPSLAWVLHVVMDALTHGTGKFQTTVFYPLSIWSFDGIRWWQHPEVVLAYWLLLPVIWYGLWTWRRRRA